MNIEVSEKYPLSFWCPFCPFGVLLSFWCPFVLLVSFSEVLPPACGSYPSIPHRFRCYVAGLAFLQVRKIFLSWKIPKGQKGHWVVLFKTAQNPCIYWGFSGKRTKRTKRTLCSINFLVCPVFYPLEKSGIQKPFNRFFIHG